MCEQDVEIIMEKMLLVEKRHVTVKTKKKNKIIRHSNSGIRRSKCKAKGQTNKHKRMEMISYTENEIENKNTEQYILS